MGEIKGVRANKGREIKKDRNKEREIQRKRDKKKREIKK